MTPAEFGAFMAGHGRRMAEDWRRTLWGAWHSAAFARAKKLPDIAKIMRRMGGRKAPPQSPEQILASLKMIMAASGIPLVPAES